VTDKNKEIQKNYDRISKIYDLLEKSMKLMTVSKWREIVIKKIDGEKNLEVGVATGKNLDVTGTDFSKKMLKITRHKSKGLGNIKLLVMKGQKMEFDDNSFDSVITFCVFCSVPDPVKGLKEIRRVCKNNRKTIMLEHMRSNNELVWKFIDSINFIPLNIEGQY
jgi:ubiquinone/menaquinone biosynthesis C-methylase UbiE